MNSASRDCPRGANLTDDKPHLAETEHPPIFFSGGTALKRLSSTFAAQGCHTVHLVTTFDSGGSTARLRAAFAMPALGDLRNRLVALADPDLCSHALVHCMETRIPDTGDPQNLRQMLVAMGREDHPVWQGINATPARCLRQCLTHFLAAMPASFDARQASLGNICMAGKYLQEHRSLNAVLGLFSRLLHVQGEVLPIVEESLHLAARLCDGTTRVGQHHFKEFTSPIQECFLTVNEPDRGRDEPVVCKPRASSAALARLREAGLVCYPMGSFFSSVVANLLADGVANVVAALDCPKIFIPNTGHDHELMGHTLCDEMRILVQTLLGERCSAADNGWKESAGLFLTHMVVDTRNGHYPGSMELAQKLAQEVGVQVLDLPLVDEDGLHHNPQKLAELIQHMTGTHNA